MDKYQKYRKKMVGAGRCPHCGKTCAPYYECEDRRAYKKSNIALQNMVKVGMLFCKKQPDGTNLYKLKNSDIRIVSHKTSDNDRRNLPRLGKKYINAKKMILDIFKENNRALHVDEVSDILMQKICDLKGMENIL